MSVEDSASDATGSPADSATGLALQLTLQPVWFFGRLGDRIGASSSLVTCLAFNLLGDRVGASADLMSGNEPLVLGGEPWR